MATVAQVAKASLQRILVQASEAPLEAADFQDFIFSMNTYMLALDAQGITLGYTEVSDLGDTVTIPTGALRGLIANMAIEVAPDYGAEISPGLALQARDGLAAMRRLGVSTPRSSFPSTLPIGSGNEGNDHDLTHFYPDEEALILAETSGPIAQESGTADAA